MDAYESRKKQWEDLEVTREELKNLTECLKKDEFRKLLTEYAEEVTNPENRKIYEKEITQLEKERGVDVTFVNPEPGYVIKTSVNGEKKCFLNICKSDIVARPSSQPSYEEGHRGLQWSIPYTLIPPRDDLDKQNVHCMVFDVAFHPDTIYLASKNTRFREIVNNTALDGVENNFKVKLDRKNLKFPKLNFKGMSQPSVIRKPSKEPPAEPLDIDPEIYQKLMSSYDENRERQCKPAEEKPQRPSPCSTYYNKKEEPKVEETKYVTPKFTIKHQSDIDLGDFTNDKDSKMYAAIPKKLIIEIDLPLLKSANDAVLDVQERMLYLKSEKPAKYELSLPLPYCVDMDNGTAKFVSKYKKLTVALPVVRSKVSSADNKEDSGVESDHGSPIFSNTEHTDTNLLGLETKDSAEETENKVAPMIEVLSETSETLNECENSALRTSDSIEVDSFMQPNIKYMLPSFVCNIYDNQLAVTINVKNVEPDSICHKFLDNNSGIHILLISVGAGFFPQYYSLCFKLKEDIIDTNSLTIEPWDNNVVFTITLKDIDNLAHYYVGLDEQFLEEKDLPTPALFKNKLQELTAEASEPDTSRKIEVLAEGDSVLVNINSNNLDSDDEDDLHARESTTQRKTRKHMTNKSRSISESSGDELPSSNNSSVQAKGILKSSRSHDFSRSVSESSADENGIPVPSVDSQYDYNHDANSESECSSLKKTVRFNDVVSRQLFRSNSSILGQRKKNQRKLRNKKRAHERRLSESENSETEDRDKYKVNQKASDKIEETCDNVKPILNRDKQSDQQKIITEDVEKLKHENAPPKNSETNTRNKKAVDVSEISYANIEVDVQAEFKNDLIFDLDM